MGQLIRDVRQAIGWSQRELGRRVHRSQSWISRAERGLIGGIAATSAAAALEAMGARLVLEVSAPHLADRARQRDPAHARLVAHIANRLRRAGWRVATEVEIGRAGARGWMDVLAWHPDTGLLLLIEVKTEIHDLGGIQRTMRWYEREAWAAARRLGWNPRRLHSGLLLLFTEANERRAMENREAFGIEFPCRAVGLAEAIATGVSQEPAARSIALVDPRSRRSQWVRLLRMDGRRGAAPYADYADFVGFDGRRARMRRGASTPEPARVRGSGPRPDGASVTRAGTANDAAGRIPS